MLLVAVVVLLRDDLARQGFHHGEEGDGPNRHRPIASDRGRKKVGEPFLATHTHLSLNRGTPERSYGKFAR